MDNEKRDEINSEIFERTKLFFDRKLEVHISCKRNGFRFFYNGIIKEINPKFIILEENRVGEVPIQFSEIYDIEKFINKEGE
jgi:hypothetical protein